MPFKILEDIATADVAFEASGKNLEEMFKSAALAVSSIMVKLDTLEPVSKKVIEITDKDVEKLLVRFLNEIIFIKDSDMLLFNRYHIEIKKNRKYALRADMMGEKINMDKHTLGVDVKAVTYHMLEVKQEEGIWKARIILDI